MMTPSALFHQIRDTTETLSHRSIKAEILAALRDVEARAFATRGLPESRGTAGTPLTWENLWVGAIGAEEPKP